MLKATLWQSAATAAVLCAMAMPAQAQQADDADPQAEEATGGAIIVTARRREERLVDVPVAVTSFRAEELKQRGSVDITDIAQVTPNTTLEESRGTNSTLSAFIRGIGQQDPVSGFEQGVGIYLDDVYLNRPQAAVLDIYDVERIEVLRGPQGTLYGRNTIGGAVKYVTRELPDETSPPTARHRWHLWSGGRRGHGVHADQRRYSRRWLGRAPFARWLRRKPHHRRGKLQQGYLGSARHSRDRRQWRAGTDPRFGRLLAWIIPTRAAAIA